MAIATPAVEIAVRNGRRCHSLKESCVQVTSASFQSFRREKSTRLPGRIEPSQYTGQDTHDYALPDDGGAHGKERFVRGEGHKTLHQVFHTLPSDQGQHNAPKAPSAG